jgi:hypothetical protein
LLTEELAEAKKTAQEASDHRQKDKQKYENSIQLLGKQYKSQLEEQNKKYETTIQLMTNLNRKEMEENNKKFGQKLLEQRREMEDEQAKFAQKEQNLREMMGVLQEQCEMLQNQLMKDRKTRQLRSSSSTSSSSSSSSSTSRLVPSIIPAPADLLQRFSTQSSLGKL